MLKASKFKVVYCLISINNQAEMFSAMMVKQLMLNTLLITYQSGDYLMGLIGASRKY